MSQILIVYSSTDGQTLKICNYIENTLVKQDVTVTLAPVDELYTLDLKTFDKFILGSSVRYGKHCKKLRLFIDQNEGLLNSKPNALFSVNLVARKPEKRDPKANPYLKKFLTQINWQPKMLAVFPGKVDYPKYRFFDRILIQFIMWMTKGPTDCTAVIEYTDWEQVEEFCKTFNRMCSPPLK